MSDLTFDPTAPSLALFNRRYRLQVEDIDVTGLQVRFTVKRSLSAKSSNRCEIEVFNLSSETRKRLHGMRSVFCSLEAGYDSGTSVIFRGDVLEAWSNREGTEWVTTISSEDGGKSRKKKRIQHTFIQGTTIQQIIGSLADALALGRGNVDQVAALAKFWGTASAAVVKGYTASGDAVTQLDRVARSCGFEWSIQDGELQFLAIGDALPDAPVILSATTGLVDSPELGKDQIVKCRSLIFPGLYPGRQIDLRSRHVHGLYRVETSTHSGDYRGEEWYCDLELTTLRR